MSGYHQKIAAEAKPLLTRAGYPTATGEHKGSREHEGQPSHHLDGLGSEKILAFFRDNKTEELLQEIIKLDFLSKQLNKLQYVLVVLDKEETFQATDQSILRVIQTFHHLLEDWNKAGQKESVYHLPRYIAILLYRAGKLVKCFSPTEKLEALRTVNALLTTLGGRPDAAARSIASALLGVGYLANNENLAGILPSDSITALLTALESKPDATAQEIANALLGAGYLANNENLAGALPSALMTALLTKLKSRPDTTGQVTANALLGMDYCMREPSWQDNAASQQIIPKLPDKSHPKKGCQDFKKEQSLSRRASSSFSSSRDKENAPRSNSGEWSHNNVPITVERIPNRFLDSNQYCTPDVKREIGQYLSASHHVSRPQHQRTPATQRPTPREHKGSREHEGQTHHRRDRLGPDQILASFRNNETEELLQEITGLDSLSERLNKLQYVLIVLDPKNFQAKDHLVWRVMQTFHQQLKVWVNTGKTEPIDNLPKYIATLLHRAGKLVKRFSPAEKLEALRTVNALLTILKDTHDLDAQAIANALLGAGYLAKNNNLAGILSSASVTALLSALEGRRDLHAQAIANTLLGVGYLANHNRLRGTLRSASIEALLTTLESRRDLEAQHIVDALLGAGYLAKNNNLTGTLHSASIEALLTTLESRRDLEEQHIANAQLGVGYLKEQSQSPHTPSHLSSPQAPRSGSGSLFSSSHQQSRPSQDHFREKKETPDLTAQHDNGVEMTHSFFSSSLFGPPRNEGSAPRSNGGMWSHDEGRQYRQDRGDWYRDSYSSSSSPHSDCQMGVETAQCVDPYL